MMILMMLFCAMVLISFSMVGAEADEHDEMTACFAHDGELKDESGAVTDGNALILVLDQEMDLSEEVEAAPMKGKRDRRSRRMLRARFHA